MKKENLFFLILPFSQILIVAGDYMSMGYRSVFAYAGMILGVIADIILLYVLVRGAQKEKVEKELEEVRYLNEIENRKNNLLWQQQNNLQEMRTNLENRIQYIMNRLEDSERSKEIAQEIDNLQKHLESAKENNYCQNAVVNAVVSEKDKNCRHLGFALDVDLIVPGKLAVEPLHICSIFSNLLDNALEAVEELEESKRKIEIRAELKGNYLFVKVRNTSTKEHAGRKRRKERGYGSLILNDIAKKYDGNYVTSYKDGYYSAVVAVKAV